MHLSPHFTLAELTHSNKAQALGLSNEATPEIVDKLQGVAEVLEAVRIHLSNTANKNVPVIVTSGYRSPELNKAVGGVTSSDHTKGRAADIVAPAFGSAYDVAECLAPHVSALGIEQLILEGVKGKEWVHISTAAPAKPMNRIITITDAGAVAGIKRLA